MRDRRARRGKLHRQLALHRGRLAELGLAERRRVRLAGDDDLGGGAVVDHGPAGVLELAPERGTEDRLGRALLGDADEHAASRLHGEVAQRERRRWRRPLEELRPARRPVGAAEGPQVELGARGVIDAARLLHERHRRRRRPVRAGRRGVAEREPPVSRRPPHARAAHGNVAIVERHRGAHGERMRQRLPWNDVLVLAAGLREPQPRERVGRVGDHRGRGQSRRHAGPGRRHRRREPREVFVVARGLRGVTPQRERPREIAALEPLLRAAPAGVHARRPRRAPLRDVGQGDRAIERRERVRRPAFGPALDDAQPRERLLRARLDGAGDARVRRGVVLGLLRRERARDGGAQLLRDGSVGARVRVRRGFGAPDTHEELLRREPRL